MDKSDRPVEDVLVTHCGELERRKKKTADRQSEDLAPNESLGRGRRKRRHSAHKDSEPSRSPSRHKDVHHRDRAVLRSSSSHGSHHHRRSDHAVDETLRGRTRHYSCARSHGKSPPAEKDGYEQSPRRKARRRSPPPSRDEPAGSGSTSPGYRRRRSLPNHYERRKVGTANWGHNAEAGLKEFDRDRDRDPTRERHRGALAENRSIGSGRLGGDHDEDGGMNRSGITFKGRGNMKFRELTRG